MSEKKYSPGGKPRSASSMHRSTEKDRRITYNGERYLPGEPTLVVPDHQPAFDIMKALPAESEVPYPWVS